MVSHSSDSSSGSPAGGSPPHARGRVAPVGTEKPADRITPACAGKSTGPRRASDRPPDHPRMRGEESRARALASAMPGSPPHARGRGAATAADVQHPGITPACAGKSAPDPGPQPQSADHPRMRGEEHQGRNLNGCPNGSPPHARGREPPLIRDGANQGITPACAGKRPPPTGPARSIADHPRMRGEELTMVPSGDGETGSPPHARGREPTKRPPIRALRITPACAGKRPAVCR